MQFTQNQYVMKYICTFVMFRKTKPKLFICIFRKFVVILQPESSNRKSSNRQ